MSIKSQVDYTSLMLRAEKSFSKTSGTLDLDAIAQSRVSTGLLTYDLVLGGGIIPGWYTIYGDEGSGKTLIQTTIFAACLHNNVHLLSHWDYEQALDANNVGNVLKSMLGKKENEEASKELDQLLGVKDPKTGKYLVEPRLWYYPADVGEEFYKMTSSILRNMPDKVYSDNKWWYVWDNTQANRKLANAAGTIDKKKFTATNKFWVEASDGAALQMMTFIDSYQAMNPEAQEEEDSHNGMAQDARMHAAHLKKVRGKLRKKQATVIGISQIRLNPGARFGNPEYVTGGKTLAHAADCRNKHTARSVPHGKGPIEEEPSVIVENASDTYKYIHVKNEKNKFSSPYIQVWMRVWIDHEGNCRGFCPAYDTLMYLMATGRVEGYSDFNDGKIPRKFTFTLGGHTFKKINWLDFKALVVLKGTALKEHCEGMGLKKKDKVWNPKIRETCMEELTKGNGFDLFNSIRVGGVTVKGEAEDDDGDGLDIDEGDE